MIADEKVLISEKMDTELELTAPKQYYVMMHNDDTTPFDFVIEVLVKLFHHEPETATDLAAKIHNDGNAIVGMYYMEIAEQKVEETTRISRNNGLALITTIEPAE